MVGDGWRCVCGIDCCCRDSSWFCNNRCVGGYVRKSRGSSRFCGIREGNSGRLIRVYGLILFVWLVWVLSG